MSTTRSPLELRYGRTQPPLEPVPLRAGPLALELHGPDLRYVRSGANEVCRRIYMAVRDLNWNTLPVTVENLEVDDRGDSFRVRFDARNRDGAADFSWTGTIEGSADGAVSYTMDGVAANAFAYAKIGLCIHHPLRESAGRLFHGAAPATPVGGALPSFVGPQINLRDEGWDLPLFEPVEWFSIDLPHGEPVRFDFEGDLFEMEDQRNWTDGSLKTSSTPASLGYHFEIRPGERVRQVVRLAVEGAAPAAPGPRDAGDSVLRVSGPTGLAVPPIGLGAASHGEPPSGREAELLRALAPAHLRFDLHPGGTLDAALATCEALGCELELALFLDGGDQAALEAAATALAGSQVRLARVLVFDDGAEVTPLAHVDLVRERLAAVRPQAPVGGGTNVYFNELNRNRPDPYRLDVVAYSVNPQIHAFDELSLVESLEAQPETVRSARAFCGATPVAVTPVTLRPRFNAVAVVAEPDDAGGLPRPVDPRQVSLFGAAWTLGSVAALAGAGAASLTYYETTGWRGVVEREAGSPQPGLFPSTPGQPFPLYHVLADACELRGAELLECRPDDPLAVAALAVAREGRTTLLVANLTGSPRTARLEGLSGPATVRRLNEQTAPERGPAERLDDAARLDLLPFETVRIDT